MVDLGQMEWIGQQFGNRGLLLSLLLLTVAGVRLLISGQLVLLVLWLGGCRRRRPFLSGGYFRPKCDLFQTCRGRLDHVGQWKWADRGWR